MNPFRTGSVAVDFVNHANSFEALIECLSKYPSCLRLWASDGISEKEHTIDHFHDSLHLGTEVGVARGVDDVNGVFFAILWIDPFNRQIFGLNCNPFFAFEIHRVHRALLHFLVFTVGAALLKQAVHESSLAVINVGDDGDITDVFGVHRKETESWELGASPN